VVCNLRWEWEVRLEQVGFSVFVVPKRYVKGRRHDRVLVSNSVAQSIIESVRAMHPQFVFVYSHPRHKAQNYRPIETMNNTAWQSWRKRCGLHGFRVHDLRHTAGMRLREAGVPESTRADILWHSHAGMTAHYSVAQVVEIREALEKITDERHANNVSLASIIREAKVPTKVPTEAKRPEAALVSGR
jgi:integrase